jgi:hypothetical protein
MTLRKVVAYPVMVLAAAGVFACVTLFILGLAGIFQLPKSSPLFLFMGILVVWLPTVILHSRLTRDFKQKDLLKAVLRGCPPWMRKTLWISIGGAIAGTFLAPNVSGRSPEDPAQAFVLLPVIFYAASYCVLYSAINVERVDSRRRCLKGHALAPLAKFCEECGAPVAVDTRSA